MGAVCTGLLHHNYTHTTLLSPDGMGRTSSEAVPSHITGTRVLGPIGSSTFGPSTMPMASELTDKVHGQQEKVWLRPMQSNCLRRQLIHVRKVRRNGDSIQYNTIQYNTIQYKQPIV